MDKGRVEILIWLVQLSAGSVFMVVQPTFDLGRRTSAHFTYTWCRW